MDGAEEWTSFEEEVIVKPPRGFEDKGSPSLKKGLHRPKPTPRKSYKTGATKRFHQVTLREARIFSGQKDGRGTEKSLREVRETPRILCSAGRIQEVGGIIAERLREKGAGDFKTLRREDFGTAQGGEGKQVRLVL